MEGEFRANRRYLCDWGEDIGIIPISPDSYWEAIGFHTELNYFKKWYKPPFNQSG